MRKEVDDRMTECVGILLHSGSYGRKITNFGRKINYIELIQSAEIRQYLENFRIPLPNYHSSELRHPAFDGCTRVATTLRGVADRGGVEEHMPCVSKKPEDL